MPCYCAAFNCREKAVKGGHSFHGFPKDPYLCKQWVTAMRRKDFIPTKHSRLCSKHFSPNSFNTSPWSSVQSLKPDAVPSIFDFPDNKQSKRPGKPPDWERESVSSFKPASGALGTAGSLEDIDAHPITTLPIQLESNQTLDVKLKTSSLEESRVTVPSSAIANKCEPELFSTTVPSDIVVCEYNAAEISPNGLCVASQNLESMMSGNPVDESPMGAPLEVAKSEEVKEVEPADEYELTVTEESLVRLHGLSLDLPVPCDLCPIGTVFDDLDEFDAHMSEHLEAKMFACQLCSNTYRSWSNLVAHRKMFHLGEVLSCEICGSNKTHTRLEGAVHFPVEGKPHGCEECQIGLNTISDVYQHFFQHKAPPCGNRQRPCKHLGPYKKRKRSAKAKSGIKNQNMSVDMSRSLKLNGGSVQCGNLPVGTVSGNPSGAQNGSIIRSVFLIPSGASIDNMPGIKGGKLVLMPAVIKGGGLIGSPLGSQSKKKSVEVTKVSGGDITVNPVSLQSGDSTINQPGPSNVKLLRDVAEVGTWIAIENATENAVESQSSPVDSTKTHGEVLSGDSNPEKQRENQNMVLPDIPSKAMDTPPSEELKSCPEKSGNKSETVKKPRERKRAKPPENGLENISDPALNGGSIPEGNKGLVKKPRRFCPHCNSSYVKLVDYRKHVVRESVAHDCIMCSSYHLEKLLMKNNEYCPVKTQRFLCIPCGTRFKSDAEFTTHLKEHHTQGPLPCCLCGRKINSSQYVDHIRSCQQKCIDWEFRKQQISQRIKPEGNNGVVQVPKHLCPHCNSSYVKLTDYRKHLARESEAHNCVMCSINHLKKLLTKDHEYCQPNTQQFCCMPCGSLFESEAEFTTHLNEHHTHDPLPCCLCGRKVDSIQYVDHIRTCQQKCIDWELQKQPISRTCDLCGKTFHSISSIRKHLKRHEANRKISLYCRTCERMFQHKGAYSKHLWANPTHGPPEHRARFPGTCTDHVCERCGKTFAKRGSLKLHLRKHDGLRPYACPSCPKSFLSGTALSFHVRRHTGDRPYMCEICGKSFTMLKSLVNHQQAHKDGKNMELNRRIRSENTKSIIRKINSNPNAKRYPCPFCGKILSSKLIYDGHVRHHTGERPYPCDICGRAFTLAKVLKLHRKGHEKSKTEDKVQSVSWVHSETGLENKGEVHPEGVFEDNPTETCVYFCPRCGVGLVSPGELEEHLAKGDCLGVGAETYCITVGQ